MLGYRINCPCHDEVVSQSVKFLNKQISESVVCTELIITFITLYVMMFMSNNSLKCQTFLYILFFFSFILTSTTKQLNNVL